MKPREAAYRVVYEVLYRNGYSTIVLDNIRREQGYSNLDASFVTNIAMGTLRNSIFLEYIIKEYSSISIGRISPQVMTVLKTGAYQILFMDRVPDSAACNESVKIAGRFGGVRSKGFVNGVLRTISRNKDGIGSITDGLAGTDYLSVKYSFSKEAVETVTETAGAGETAGILANLNKPPELCIRNNSRADLELEMEKQGIIYEKGMYGLNAYYISPGTDIAETGLYKEGMVAIQDEGAQEMVEFLGPREGEHILDACAAPGGKTAYIHFLTKGKSMIDAFDSDCQRVERMKGNLNRLGAFDTKTECRDMSDSYDYLRERYDAILLDVPCSGLGTSQRRPEIKLDYKTSNALVELQSRILHSASGMLKRGGRMVYGTCTLNRNENDIQVNAFVEQNDGFELKEEKTILPDGRRGGFYMAKLVKND